jgi:ATP-dependent Lhr-like helicase
MEVGGPISADSLQDLFQLPPSEIQSALIALEAEGFILRGKFHPGVTGIEWCDRRLLARIHRLTINKLRAEIQPVSIAEFQRFLLAWQRADAEHRVRGVDGLKAVLELLDGCELPAASWEPEVLALRVDDYAPELLDQLCFTGRIGWGRFSLPETRNARLSGPIRSSPMSLFARENLGHWLALAAVSETTEFSPDAGQIVDALKRSGALFFGEIVRLTRLLPSRVEPALAELAANGHVTADSFEGLRALLLPEGKRAPFAEVQRRRHHKSVTSVEFAGRWSLLRKPLLEGSEGEPREIAAREESTEAFARVLLRRYGVVSRRIAEKESLSVPWFELIRVFRRFEARGEVRGGYFVGGLSGEQFARPEAIGLLRSIRKAKANGELLTISAADPLNLVGILAPGPRIAAITPHRILLRDGVPIAALKAGAVVALNGEVVEGERVIENALRIGTIAPKLRAYYV